MINLINNAWFQGISCGLITALICELIRRALRAGYPSRVIFFSIFVSSTIFVFGNILQPAVQNLLQGNPPFYWLVIIWLRENSPGSLLFGLFLAGIFPGVITGVMVARGRSFRGRIGYSVLWAPLSLTVCDAFAIYLVRHLQVFNWEDVFFSLLSNIFGGIVGGLIIGSAVHLFIDFKRASMDLASQ